MPRPLVFFEPKTHRVVKGLTELGRELGMNRVTLHRYNKSGVIKPRKDGQWDTRLVVAALRKQQAALHTTGRDNPAILSGGGAAASLPGDDDAEIPAAPTVGVQTDALDELGRVKDIRLIREIRDPLVRAKGEKMFFDARKAELDVMAREGRMIETAKVRREVGMALGHLANRMDQMPREVSPQMRAARNEEEAEAILAEAIREVFRSVREQLMAGGVPVDEPATAATPGGVEQ